MKVHGRFMLAAVLAVSTSAHAVELMSPKSLVTVDATANMTGLAVAGDGSFVAMLQRGTTPKVSFQRYDSLGAKVGAETPVQGGTGARIGGKIGRATNGDFVTTWCVGSPGDGVAARIYTADGTAKTAPIAVAATGGNSTVAVAPNGDFVVAWNTSADAVSILARPYAADGTPKSDAVVVQTTTTAVAAFDVAIAQNGDFAVAFEGYTPRVDDPFYGQGIYLRRFNANGTPKAAEALAFKDDFAASHSPSIASTLDGALMLAWTREAYGPGEPEQVQGRCFLADGTAKTEMFTLNKYQYGARDNVHLAVTGENFVATWQAGGQAPSKTSIIGERVAVATCAINGSEFIVTPLATFNQLRPAISTTPAGDTLIGWNAAGQAARARFYQHQPGKPTVTLLGSNEDINEGSKVRIFASLSKKLAAPVTVDLIVQGTADIGSDFKLAGANIKRVGPIRYQLTFPAGVRTVGFTMNALADAEADPGEYVIFTLDMGSAPTLAPGPGQIHLTGIF